MPDTVLTIYMIFGEFNQKGTIRTKYGSKDEYLEAIYELHKNDIKVYADIVLNHKMGADKVEQIYAVEGEEDNRNIENGKLEKINAWTKYTFDNRHNKYSDFKWNYSHFAGADWDERSQKNGIFRFVGRKWAEDVDVEKGNFDYLMGTDIDHENEEVKRELARWGRWYLEFTSVDNLRLDAVKHISAKFMKEWVEEMREVKPLECVGEYWNRDMNAIRRYIEDTNGEIPLFDVPLHYNFFDAANSAGNYDLSKLLDNTILKERPDLAVTFVDNHDTEPGQALASWVDDWFKEISYAIILLRKEGLPCVFYGDYYGVKQYNLSAKGDMLNRLIMIRDKYAYGDQADYFDDRDVVGFTRFGDDEHENSGMAVILSDSCGGNKNMYVGTKLVNCELYDITGKIKETTRVDENGNVNVWCNGGSVSIWVKKQ